MSLKRNRAFLKRSVSLKFTYNDNLYIPNRLLYYMIFVEIFAVLGIIILEKI